jgi:hypothetical protein
MTKTPRRSGKQHRYLAPIEEEKVASKGLPLNKLL